MLVEYDLKLFLLQYTVNSFVKPTPIHDARRSVTRQACGPAAPDAAKILRPLSYCTGIAA